MKRLLIPLVLLLSCGTAIGQDDFTGMIRYRLTADSSQNTDSMTVILDKQRIKVILYFPDAVNTKKVTEMAFIDDLIKKTTTTLNAEKKTYKTDTLNTTAPYTFTNIWKIEGATNGELCVHFRADAKQLNRSKISRVDCLGALNYLTSQIKEYYFLGVQPIIIDNRIVMEFIVTKNNGIRERTSVLELDRMDNVDRYFELKGYKEGK